VPVGCDRKHQLTALDGWAGRAIVDRHCFGPLAHQHNPTNTESQTDLEAPTGETKY